MWFKPPDQLVLLDEEVQVWRAWLDSAGNSSVLADLLSASERQKATCFRFSRDRHRFIVAHGVLRCLLGRYLRRDPSSLHFQTNEFGKPSLLVEDDGDAINFNLSHSHDMAVFAFVRQREVGIDVEQVRPELAELAVAQQFFAPEEIIELLTLDPSLRLNGFFNCWTRKESYIKARGMGLSLPLDEFQVSLRPGFPAVLLYHSSDPAEPSRWDLYDLSPGKGYAGALAVRGRDLHIRTWQWSSELLFYRCLSDRGQSNWPTTTESGLWMKALDTREHEPGQKITDDEMHKLRAKPHRFHGDCNYAVPPRRPG